MADFRKFVSFATHSQVVDRLSRPLFFLCFLFGIIAISACSIPQRTGYDRNIGAYKPTTTSQTSQTAQNQNSAAAAAAPAPPPTAQTPKTVKQTSAGAVKTAATKKSIPTHEPPKTSFENYARQWLGAKYVYGAAEKTRTDCSGYVMQVYKGYWNIALDHNAGKIYKDSRGSSVSRGSLKEGDLVFFGSFWKIDHIGIYLSGDRFIHASTSKGVMISPMNDKYWSPKYQGGRRFF